jgi:hypothetical protein
MKKQFYYGLVAIILIALLYTAVTNHRATAKELNTSWVSGIQSFAFEAYHTQGLFESLAPANNALPTERPISFEKLMLQYENLKNLPYSHQVLTQSSHDKFLVFLTYQGNVYYNSQQELTATGYISTENRERAAVIADAWENIVPVLEKQINNTAIRSTFQKDHFRDILNDAISKLDEIELIPL